MERKIKIVHKRKRKGSWLQQGIGAPKRFDASLARGVAFIHYMNLGHNLIALLKPPALASRLHGVAVALGVVVAVATVVASVVCCLVRHRRTRRAQAACDHAPPIVVPRSQVVV